MITIFIAFMSYTFFSTLIPSSHPLLPCPHNPHTPNFDFLWFYCLFYCLHCTIHFSLLLFFPPLPLSILSSDPYVPDLLNTDPLTGSHHLLLPSRSTTWDQVFIFVSTGATLVQATTWPNDKRSLEANSIQSGEDVSGRQSSLWSPNGDMISVF